MQRLDRDTKITWATSPRFGPFKARDFCTLVHFRRVADPRGGPPTLVVVNLPADHESAPRAPGLVRSEVIIAGYVLRPLTPPGADQQLTEITTITSIDPGGGAANSPAGARIMNKLAANAPIFFIRRLEAAAQKDDLTRVEGAGEGWRTAFRTRDALGSHFRAFRETTSAWARPASEAPGANEAGPMDMEASNRDLALSPSSLS